MKINPLISICRRLPLPALAAIVALAVGGCNVTQPDEGPWRDASAYSWPINRAFLYRTDTLATGGYAYNMMTAKITTADNALRWDGSRYFQLRDTAGSRAPRLFLPLKDTLLTLNTGIPSELGLVTPLEKGHSWTCGTSIEGVPWKATILERYSFRKIEGIVYKNVIEVEYKPEVVTNDDIVVVTRFYAEGQGVVQTLESVIQRQDNPDNPLPTVQTVHRQRTVLVGTESAPKM